MRKGKLRYLWLLVAIVSLFMTGFVRGMVEESNRVHQLNPFTSTTDTPPAELGVAMSLGVFRSVLIDFLWLRAAKLQQEKRYYEIVQLYDLIGKLQPYNGKVWVYAAWNMAYNISVDLPPGDERWRWVKNGIDRLKFQGLKYNPDDRQLYNQLAWIYSHKFGKNTDDAHLVYKTRLYEEVEAVMGGYHGSTLGLWEKLQSGTEEEQAHAKQIQKELKSEFNMELKNMVELENDPNYGPVDWRLPAAHCFYWAEEGLKRKDPRMRDIDLQRKIYQAMLFLLRKGTVLYQPAIGSMPASVRNLPDYRQAMPILKLLLKNIEIFEREIRANGIKNAYMFFVQESVEILTFAGEEKLAEEFFQMAKKGRPDIDLGAYTAKEFIQDNLEERLKELNGDQFSALVSSALLRHFLWKAKNNKKKSAAFLKRANALWSVNKEINSSGERHVNRSFKQVYDSVLVMIYMRRMLHPDDLKQLESHIEPQLLKNIHRLMIQQRQAFEAQRKQQGGKKAK